MSQKVLIVDDNKDFSQMLSQGLMSFGFEVCATENLNFLGETVRMFQPKAVILDFELGAGITAVDVIESFRRSDNFSDIPIIVVSGHPEESKKIQCLKIGADDYVVKPVSISELSARIQANLRRCRTSKTEEHSSFEFGDLKVCLKNHAAWIMQEQLNLTLTEFRILCELLRNKDGVLSRDTLRESALGKVSVSDRTIDVHMASLRKKLRNYGKAVQTVRGVGYRFNESLVPAKMQGTQTQFGPSSRSYEPMSVS